MDFDTEKFWKLVSEFLSNPLQFTKIFPLIKKNNSLTEGEESFILEFSSLFRCLNPLNNTLISSLQGGLI